MRRKALLIFLSAIMIFFVSCASENGAESEITEEYAPLTIRGEENIPEDIKLLNEKAKVYIAEKYGRKALDFLVLESATIIDESASRYKGCPEFKYNIDVYGYGWGRLRFIFDAEDELAYMSEQNDEPLFYSEMLDKEEVDRAAARIAKQAGEPIEGREYYYFVDDQKYLCLGTEIIVEFDEVQPDGSLVHDHRHMFYKERLVISPRDIFDLFE